MSRFWNQMYKGFGSNVKLDGKLLDNTTIRVNLTRQAINVGQEEFFSTFYDKWKGKGLIKTNEEGLELLSNNFKELTFDGEIDNKKYYLENIVLDHNNMKLVEGAINIEFKVC